MITVGVVTSSRADFGYYSPLLRAMDAEDCIDYRIVATGSHLASDHGYTADEITSKGFDIYAKVESLANDDSPAGIANSIANGVAGFSEIFTEWQPEVLLVFGDRYDMYPAAVAALPFNIPVAHISGGEVTIGAFDEALRHSMTKLSHLHFPSTKEYASRIMRMGEESWRVTTSGSLAIDAINELPNRSRTELAEAGLIDSGGKFGLVTFHPVTLEVDQTETQIENLLSALSAVDLGWVFTAPNTDTKSSVIFDRIESFCAERANRRLLINAGSTNYLNMMKYAELMVGNSSSGIMEAPSFELPVVNIGTRQDGRTRGDNIIDTGNGVDEIISAIQLATSSDFRSRLRGTKNPFGDGRASRIIIDRLLNIESREMLIKKRFSDEVTRGSTTESNIKI